MREMKKIHERTEEEIEKCFISKVACLSLL